MINQPTGPPDQPGPDPARPRRRPVLGLPGLGVRPAEGWARVVRLGARRRARGGRQPAAAAA
ncbi:hypothetical protein ACFW1A_40460, partial [Kitasatospora sp. NPDC058965]|uniref:hypothetical protein n=1 Tax=Kitasatospora sp. NPDC058965 TaxID=3346682 RepID=UPI0036B74536